jgi:hypothetical protein
MTVGDPGRKKERPQRRGAVIFGMLSGSDTVAVLEAIPGIVFILDRAAIPAAQTRS